MARRRTQFAPLPGALQDTVFLDHLHDTPDFERVMVWTVYEMASFGRELGIHLPYLGCQPDALVGAYGGDARRSRVESAHCRIFLDYFR